MPRRPRGELRKALVSIAGELLAQTGSAAAVSVEDVVVRANCSPPALYYYFETKDELMLEVTLSRLEAAASTWARPAGIASRTSHGDVRDGILTAGHAFLDWAHAQASFFRTLFGSPQFAAAATARGEEIIATPLNAAVAAGRVADSEHAAATLWGVLLGFAWLASHADVDLAAIHANFDRAARGTIASLDGARRRVEEEQRRLPRLFGGRGR